MTSSPPTRRMNYSTSAEPGDSDNAAVATYSQTQFINVPTITGTAQTQFINAPTVAATVQTQFINAPTVAATAQTQFINAPTVAATAQTFFKPNELQHKKDLMEVNLQNPLTSTVTTYHVPRGTPAVANISVPRGPSLPVSSIIRTTPVSQISTNTTFSQAMSSSGFIQTLSRPGSTWVVATTASSAMLQKSSQSAVSTLSLSRSSTTMTMTTRFASSAISKQTDVSSIKPIIVHNSVPKQIITQPVTQQVGPGLLKGSVGMVTIRGGGFTQPPHGRVTIAAPGQRSPRVASNFVPVPVRVPSAGTVRKPQTLAPKVIAQSTRVPFTVQSIPVSVNHTPSPLTINKKTAGVIASNMVTTNANQVRPATGSVVTKLFPVNAEMKTPVAATNLIIQGQKPQGNSANALTSFAAPGCFMYEKEFQIQRTLVSSSNTAFTNTVSSLSSGAVQKHFSLVSPTGNNQIPRLNPIVVVESPRPSLVPSTTHPSSLTIQSAYVLPQGTTIGQVHIPQPQQQQFQQLQQLQQQQQQQQQQLQLPSQSRCSTPPLCGINSVKLNLSPRPSILRKREADCSTLKVQRNLSSTLNAVSTTSPPASPHTLDPPSSSNSSTTLSATSSPGRPTLESPTPRLAAIHDECNPSSVDMSPRKKPRKQQLTSTVADETKLEEDIEFICNSNNKKDDKRDNSVESSESKTSSAPKKKRNISILSGYNYGWKSKHHHFLRYSDVKYKDDKKQTVNDIANQKYVSQKICGWKMYHLSSQMENLFDIEIEVVDKLTPFVKMLDPSEDRLFKDVNAAKELLMNNMQRSKVLSNQLTEAKETLLNIITHKQHVSELITKCANKRTIRKKGKYY